MATEKLYYADAFLKEFTATVISCEAAKTGFAVVLDRTAFYPEGGGQPADHGTLGDAAVTDVHEKDGVVFHTCNKAVDIGGSVSCTVDWQRRFDHMQQHSGEHILSGLICASHGYDNVGFHMGADTVTIDFNGPLTDEEAAGLERRANQYIYENHPIEIAYPSPAELEALPYRSKKELSGEVRIVTFPGADCCACCGTHVSFSGQVGLVKILSCQKFREGVRMEILSGRRALEYLSRVWDQDKAVGQALSVKPTDTAAAVERLKAELAEERTRRAQLEAEVFASIAAANQGAGNVTLFQGPLSGDAPRRLADAVATACGGRCCVFAENGAGFHYAIVEKGADIKDFVKALNAACNGRGGGRDGFAQGSVQADRAAIEAFLAG